MRWITTKRESIEDTAVTAHSSQELIVLRLSDARCVASWPGTMPIEVPTSETMVLLGLFGGPSAGN